MGERIEGIFACYEGNDPGKYEAGLFTGPHLVEDEKGNAAFCTGPHLVIEVTDELTDAGVMK